MQNEYNLIFNCCSNIVHVRKKRILHWNDIDMNLPELI